MSTSHRVQALLFLQVKHCSHRIQRQQYISIIFSRVRICSSNEFHSVTSCAHSLVYTAKMSMTAEWNNAHVFTASFDNVIKLYCSHEIIACERLNSSNTKQIRVNVLFSQTLNLLCIHLIASGILCCTSTIVLILPDWPPSQPCVWDSVTECNSLFQADVTQFIS